MFYFKQFLDKPKMSIKIGNLKNSQVLEAAEEAKIKADKYEEGEITDETSEESTKSLIKTKTEPTSGDYIYYYIYLLCTDYYEQPYRKIFQLKLFTRFIINAFFLLGLEIF